MRKRDEQKAHKEMVRNYSFVAQFSLNMIVPILGCTLLGAYLDERWSTNFLAIVGFFMGAAAGYTSIYKMVKNNFSEDNKEKKDEKHH